MLDYWLAFFDLWDLLAVGAGVWGVAHTAQGGGGGRGVPAGHGLVGARDSSQDDRQQQQGEEADCGWTAAERTELTQHLVWADPKA
jgi:hypothetical protein